MRVLHIYKTYFPDTHSGVARAINAIARATAPLGVETTVLSVSRQPTTSRMNIDGHVGVTANLDFELASTPFSVSAFKRYAELVRQADVINYHFPWPQMDAMHVAIRPTRPSIVTYHSDIVRQKGLMLLYRPLMTAFLSGLDRIVATSDNYVATSPVLQRFLSKVIVIPIGIDRKFYPEAGDDLNAAWRRRLGEGFFLFTGALRYYKGLDVMIKAARMVNHPIVIVGDGPMGPTIRRRAAEQGLDNLWFVGSVDEADKLALLKLCMALVLPSNLRSEAFGVSLLEAAMMGKPMISCEIGTGTSFVNLDGATGFVVAPNDPAELAQAMNSMIGSPELRAAMGARARQRFEDEFSAALMAQRYLDLYRSVIHRRLPNPAA